MRYTLCMGLMKGGICRYMWGIDKMQAEEILGDG